MIYCQLNENDNDQTGIIKKIKYAKLSCGDESRRVSRIYKQTEDGIKLVFRSWRWVRETSVPKEPYLWGIIDFDIIPATESTPKGFVYITYHGVYTIFNGTVTQIGSLQYNDTYCKVYYSNGIFYATKSNKTYMYNGSSWVEQKVNGGSVESVKFGGAIIALGIVNGKFAVYTHDGTSFSSYRDTEIYGGGGLLYSCDDKLLLYGSSTIYDVTTSPGFSIASDGSGYNYLAPGEFLFISGSLYMYGIKIVYSVGSYFGLFKYNETTFDWDTVYLDNQFQPIDGSYRLQKCGSGALFRHGTSNYCRYLIPSSDQTIPMDMFISCTSIHTIRDILDDDDDGVTYASGVSMKGSNSSPSIYRLEEVDTLPT